MCCKWYQGDLKFAVITAMFSCSNFRILLKQSPEVRLIRPTSSVFYPVNIALKTWQWPSFVTLFLKYSHIAPQNGSWLLASTAFWLFCHKHTHFSNWTMRWPTVKWDQSPSTNTYTDILLWRISTHSVSWGFYSWTSTCKERHCVYDESFLSAFSTLRIVTICFFMSVRLSFRTEQLDNHWKDFHEIWYLSIFRKLVVEIQVPLKSDKKKGQLHIKTNAHFSSYIAELFLKLKIFHTNLKRKLKHTFYIVIYSVNNKTIYIGNQY